MPPGVTVHLFAQAREAVGRRRLSRSVPHEGVGLPRLLSELTADYPELARVLPICRFVLNGVYLDSRRTRLVPGDELGIHPPYSGG